MSIELSHASVQLPLRIEADDIIALGDQLNARHGAVVAARRRGSSAPAGCPVGAEIPAVVEASFRRFKGTVAELQVMAAQRAANAPMKDETRSQANAECDEAWRAFQAWLSGWTRHRDDGQRPSASDAQGLHAAVFPQTDGLKFIGWRPRKQWAAMGPRLATLAEPANAALVEALGGARLLAAVRETYALFGRAYGFTAAVASSEGGSNDARPQLSAAKDALREYVKKVEASADPEVAKSEALAAWLLGPFNEMVAEFASRPSGRGRRVDGMPDPVGAGTPTETPTK